MTSEDLKKANESLKAIDVKGKGYVQVNTRISAFRELFPMGKITTEILEHENGVVLMKAFVYDENEKLLGTGLAREDEKSSYINKTSYIENCETSAVGRALAMVGIGVDASMCSADELANALNNQKKEDAKKTAEANTSKITSKEVKNITAIASKKGVAIETLLNAYGINALEEMTGEQFINCLARLNKTPEKKAEGNNE